FIFFFHCYLAPLHLHSFPTRRSSDLHLAFLDPRLAFPLDPSWATFLWERGRSAQEIERLKVWCFVPDQRVEALEEAEADQDTIADRKSTRLNSSHVAISYAVFCLKKK